MIRRFLLMRRDELGDCRRVDGYEPIDIPAVDGVSDDVYFTLAYAKMEAIINYLEDVYEESSFFIEEDYSYKFRHMSLYELEAYDEQWE